MAQTVLDSWNQKVEKRALVYIMDKGETKRTLWEQTLFTFDCGHFEQELN